MKTVLSVLLATMTWAGVANAGQCIFTNSIRDWQVIDTSTIVVETRTESFALDVGRCNQLRWADAIGFENYGSRWTCTGDNVLILDNFNRAEIIGRCHIRNITKQ
jgi:hypothetical protein